MNLLIESKLFWVFGTTGCVFLLCVLAFLVVGAVWKKRNRYIGDVIDFNYLYPREIKPDGPYPFLIFITFVPGVKTSLLHRPDIAKTLVERKIDRLLEDRRSHYREETVSAHKSVSLGKYLKFKPIAKGMRFDPKRVEPEWNGKILAQHFELTASKQVLGERVMGKIRVSLWLIPIAHLGFEISVTEAAECKPFNLPELARGNVIFPSYAHEDDHVLNEFEQYAKLIGDEYLSDRRIRAGTEWKPKLLEYIAYADVFQLLWSKHALKSTFIPLEIQRAVELQKPLYPIIVEDEPDSPDFQTSDSLLEDLLKQYPQFQGVHVSSHRPASKDHQQRAAYLWAPFISSAGAAKAGAVPAFSLAGIIVVGTVAGLYFHNKINKPPEKITSDEVVVRPVERPTSEPVPAKTYSITGRIRRADRRPMRGVVVTLTNGKSEEATTDNNGRYEFKNLTEGASYVVTASQRSGVFLPSSKRLENLQKDERIPFTLQTFTISGRVTTREGGPLPYVGLVLSAVISQPGPRIVRAAVTDSEGFYSFDRIESIYEYTITPNPRQNYTFHPSSQEFEKPRANKVANFSVALTPSILTPPKIEVKLTQNPWPKLRGETASFELSVTNVGGSTAKRIQIRIRAERVINIDPHKELTHELGLDKDHWQWIVEELPVNGTKTILVKGKLTRNLDWVELDAIATRNYIMASAKVESFEDANGKKYP